MQALTNGRPILLFAKFEDSNPVSCVVLCILCMSFEIAGEPFVIANLAKNFVVYNAHLCQNHMYYVRKTSLLFAHNFDNRSSTDCVMAVKVSQCYIKLEASGKFLLYLFLRSSTNITVKESLKKSTHICWKVYYKVNLAPFQEPQHIIFFCINKTRWLLITTCEQWRNKVDVILYRKG